MYKYKLLIAYDGTHYSGWQVQPNGTSIQTLLQQALSTALRAPTSLVGSGRTDAGVHALGQVAHFTCGATFDARKLLLSLNGLLPLDIRALELNPVDPSFHARYSAIGKVYRYHLQWNLNPFKQLYSLYVPTVLDIPLMQEGARLLLGRHDFTSFSNEADRGAAAKNPVRTLRRLDFIAEEGGMVLEFEGDGFLYKMVRNIVGTLLALGRGKISLEDIPIILAAKDRRCAKEAAPAHGLFLARVEYALTSFQTSQNASHPEEHYFLAEDGALNRSERDAP